MGWEVKKWEAHLACRLAKSQGCTVMGRMGAMDQCESNASAFRRILAAMLQPHAGHALAQAALLDKVLAQTPHLLVEQVVGLVIRQIAMLAMVSGGRVSKISR